MMINSVNSVTSTPRVNSNSRASFGLKVIVIGGCAKELGAPNRQSVKLNPITLKYLEDGLTKLKKMGDILPTLKETIRQLLKIKSKNIVKFTEISPTKLKYDLGFGEVSVNSPDGSGILQALKELPEKMRSEAV